MKLAEFFVHLGHVLGILSGEDPTETGLTTSGGTTIRLTTPVILDTTTLERISSEFSKPVSPKFPSTLFSENVKDFTITGGTAKSEKGISSSTPGATTGSDATPNPKTSPTGETGGSESPDKPSVTPVVTGSETTGTGGTGSETAGTGSEPTGTGSETTETGSETTGTGSETTATGQTGSEGTGTGSESTTTDHSTHGTEAGPTDKPGLSRGAVAGIVIGCLLLVAVITSAIVFFVKNRGGPEAQRLRV